MAEQTKCSAVTVDRDSQRDEGQEEDMLGWSLEDIKTAQQEDRDIKFIIDLMEANDPKPSWNVAADQSSDVKTLFGEWERLVIVEGILLRKWTSIAAAANRRQVVMPDESSSGSHIQERPVAILAR